jgi:hypothetical protein
MIYTPHDLAGQAKNERAKAERKLKLKKYKALQSQISKLQAENASLKKKSASIEKYWANQHEQVLNKNIKLEAVVNTAAVFMVSDGSPVYKRIYEEAVAALREEPTG